MEDSILFNVPILLIAFNDCATTKKVLAKIKLIKPQQLFFAVDAPRPGNATDERGCAEVKKLIKQVDWPCETKTFFPEKNLGPRIGVSSAITWFFAQVEAGIILEHDCLPDLSFFGYCQDLLEKYKDDERVMHISGNNFAPAEIKDSYYFSRIPLIWGWATWRRAWQNYDINIKTFPEFKRDKLINNIFYKKIEHIAWIQFFENIYSGSAQTWDFQWTYAIFCNNGLAVNPAVNLVSNNGFGPGAVHSTDTSSPLANVPTKPIALPLRHPQTMIVNATADDYVMSHNLGATWHNFFLKQVLKKIGLFGLVKKFYYQLR